MKTFDQFLAALPTWEKPRDRDEVLRMKIAYTQGQMDLADTLWDEARSVYKGASRDIH